MKISEPESEHRMSAKDALIAFVGVGVLIVLVWAGWAWYQQRIWVRQMQACDRLSDMCAADCPETRRIDLEGLEYDPNPRNPIWLQPPANIYEVGCIAGCNKAGIFCSGVFGLTPSPLNP
jgi:hypothetical protein